ncbi:2-oxoglutarate dehydrogenase E1 component [Candidatus Erwinia haradaeae]|uniref:oxoglutarate dehydrogenase (succinyl-transferring) n=1 Tax=Candidatus Erwinia haradaeae TaxID=1922217 RepID=A0A451DLV2_9GAMM|nr:2-oxoglutarate dehydrogenase E1 component [Candidatus Erwinia haradaeae]VFP87742.1 2-oxoglutarate dehydrogenase E1 component [Candidatus Erwinia haradaeae]
MQNIGMKLWLESSWLSGNNQSYIDSLYKDFLNNSNSVEVDWRGLFDNISDCKEQLESCTKTNKNNLHFLERRAKSSSSDSIQAEKNIEPINLLNLINAFRCFGHQQASLDPLQLQKHKKIEALDIVYHGFKNTDLHNSFYISSFSLHAKQMTLIDIYSLLKKIYCGSIGAEFMHITDNHEKKWIQKKLELIDRNSLFSVTEKREFLKTLTAAEGLERYLGSRFPGAKRFSLEGGDALLIVINEIIHYSRKKDTHQVLLGMAHRGRLNVLVNVFGKKLQDLLNEFSGQTSVNLGSGDVKYHMGLSSNIQTADGVINISLGCNPSHLEIINPVVMGSARAHIDSFYQKDSNQVLPITIHGDAAIIGQGVVQETLNMSQVRGYQVGGTVRIVINNQVGFTTSNLQDARSSQYCTDIGKMIMAPIFHVMADDPEAVAFVTRLSLDFRYTFKRDVFIDLVCYRRHGHNEADEPSVTQPLMYQKIKTHPTVREIYAHHLESTQVINQNDAMEMVKTYRSKLDTGGCVNPMCRPKNTDLFDMSLLTNSNVNRQSQKHLSFSYLQKLAKKISIIPTTVVMQSRVKKIYTDRSCMATGNKPFDWGAAENLAYATILEQGISCRLSGEDVGRGTFFHRHAVIHDQSNGTLYIPLQHIKQGQGSFSVWDSVLSEEAVLAFEYGYAMASPHTLTIWEAQFGDFANAAQVVIDQFISSGEQKWGYQCGLVLFLPHGYEGQGPEHSSARLERYLQLCAENNIQVCVLSTPAQLYHILRLQAQNEVRRPLIIMSPKSLLRHPQAISSLDDLATGAFHSVIDEVDPIAYQSVRRVIFCTGKVYYDLLNKRRQNNQNDISIIRIEKLYPFPYQEIENILRRYNDVHDFIWCQEEPHNQGAWHVIQHPLREVLTSGSLLRYSGRPPSASPAVGHASMHHQQQKDLVSDALTIK